MALIVQADKVRETSTTTGTGTLDLDGAVTGSRTFVAGVGDGNECFYAIDNGAGKWETGRGTVTDATTDTLSRDTVFNSSNAGSLVDFSGTLQVYTTIPAHDFMGHDYCKVYRSAVQSISTSSATAVLWDAEVADPGGWHSTGSNTDRIVVPHDGLYAITINVEWGASAAGVRYLILRLNDTSSEHAVRVPPTASGDLLHALPCELLLSANDYLTLNAFQDSGGNLNFGGDGGGGSPINASFMVRRVGHAA